MTDVVRVYRQKDGKFAEPLELRRDAGDTLATPLLPGFSVSLVDVFPAR